MIELRWGPAKPEPGTDIFDVVFPPVMSRRPLQYRSQVIRADENTLYMPEWSEWRDIPIADEGG